jgi:hypothetical protein
MFSFQPDLRGYGECALEQLATYKRKISFEANAISTMLGFFHTCAKEICLPDVSLFPSMFARRVWNIPIGYIFVAPESCL